MLSTFMRSAWLRVGGLYSSLLLIRFATENQSQNRAVKIIEELYCGYFDVVYIGYMNASERKNLIALIQKHCRGQRDSRRMYEPFGTHALLGLCKRSGVKYPENIVDAWEWIRALKLRRVFLSLTREGCMIAGFCHLIPRNNQGRPQALAL